MARKKKDTVQRVGMTPERSAEIDKETEAALASARASEEKRREAKTVAEKPKPEPAAPAAPKKVVGRPFPKAPVAPGPTGTPNFVGKTQDPKMLGSKPQKKRSRTRTDKKLDRKTGKLVVPKVGRLVGTDEGTVRQVTQDDVNAIVRQPLKDAPVVRPKAAPKTRIIPNATAKPTGAGVQVGLLHGLVKQAHTHLDRMAATRGTPEYLVHQTNFHEVHATITAGDSQLGTILGIHHHSVHNPGENSEANIAAAKGAARDRLAGAGEIAKIRSGADAAESEKRKARIEAYKVGRGE